MAHTRLAVCFAILLSTSACSASDTSKTGDIPTGALSAAGLPVGALANVVLVATNVNEMESLLTMVGITADPACVNSSGWQLKCWTGWDDVREHAGSVYVAMVAGGNPCDELKGIKVRVVGTTLRVTPLVAEASGCGGGRIGMTAQLFWVDRSRLGDGLINVEGRRASPDGVEFGPTLIGVLDLRRQHPAVANPARSDAASAYKWAFDHVTAHTVTEPAPARLGFLWEDPQHPCGGGAAVTDMKLGYVMDFLPKVGSPWLGAAGGNGISLQYCGETTKPADAQ